MENETRVVNVDSYEGESVWVGSGPEPFKGSFYPFQCGFEIGVDGTREEVIAKYREKFYRRLPTDISFRHRVHELYGKTLGCTCKPLACHGDVIAEYLNAFDEPPYVPFLGRRNDGRWKVIIGTMKRK